MMSYPTKRCHGMTALSPPPPLSGLQTDYILWYSAFVIIAWFTLLHCSMIMTKILPRTFGFPVNKPCGTCVNRSHVDGSAGVQSTFRHLYRGSVWWQCLELIYEWTSASASIAYIHFSNICTFIVTFKCDIYSLPPSVLTRCYDVIVRVSCDKPLTFLKKPHTFLQTGKWSIVKNELEHTGLRQGLKL